MDGSLDYQKAQLSKEFMAALMPYFGSRTKDFTRFKIVSSYFE